MSRQRHQSSFSSFDGTNISYHVTGNGQKTLFCFNGIGVAKWVWQPLEDNFSNSFRIITWDYRGHGSSDKPHDVYKATFDDLAKDALQLIERLKPKNLYLVGHSGGFQLALEVLRRRPKDIKCLISCLGTPGHVIDDFVDPFLGHLIFDLAYIINAIAPETAKIVSKYFLNHPASYHVGAALRLVNPAINARTSIANYLAHITEMDFSLFNQLVSTATKTSGMDTLSRSKVPMLFIAAENDRFVPLNISHEMKRRAKNSELFVIKNGTHAALLEQPDIFNLCIEKFLTQL